MSAISPSAPAFILLFFLLLFFPEQSIQGASDGLLLWFHTVLPTLAPAMICTRMLLLTGGDRPADKTASSAVLQVLRFKRYWCFYSFVRNDLRIPAGTGPLCPGTGEKPDNQKRSCISARFLQLSKPHVLSRLHPRSVSRSSSGRSSSFGNLSSGTFAVMDCRTQIFPHSAFKFRGIGKQRTAAKKQKPGQRSL